MSFDSVSARHKGHRYISLDILLVLEVLLDNFEYISKRVGVVVWGGRSTVPTYGNVVLDSLIVDAQNLGWRICISN